LLKRDVFEGLLQNAAAGMAPLAAAAGIAAPALVFMAASGSDPRLATGWKYRVF